MKMTSERIKKKNFKMTDHTEFSVQTHQGSCHDLIATIAKYVP